MSKIYYKDQGVIRSDLRHELGMIDESLKEDLGEIKDYSKILDELEEFSALKQEEKDIKDEQDAYAESQGWKWDDERDSYIGITNDGQKFQVDPETVSTLESLQLFSDLFDKDSTEALVDKKGKLKSKYELQDIDEQKQNWFERTGEKFQDLREKRQEKRMSKEQKEIEKALDLAKKEVKKKAVDTVVTSGQKAIEVIDKEFKVTSSKSLDPLSDEELLSFEQQAGFSAEGLSSKQVREYLSKEDRPFSNKELERAYKYKDKNWAPDETVNKVAWEFAKDNPKDNSDLSNTEKALYKAMYGLDQSTAFKASHQIRNDIKLRLHSEMFEGFITGRDKNEAHTEIVEINGRDALVTKSEKEFIDKYGKIAADYIHEFTIKTRGSVEIDEATGLPKYGFFASMFSTIGTWGKAIAAPFMKGGKVAAFAGKAVQGLGAMGSAMGAASPILSMVANVLGKRKEHKAKVKAAKARSKALGTAIRQADKARHDVNTRAYTQFEEMAERADEQATALGEATGERYEDLSETIGKMQKQTKGLKTGAVDMMRDEGQEMIEEQHEQSFGKMGDMFKDQMDAALGQTKSYFEKAQSNITQWTREKAEADRQARKKFKWYKNLF
tara:strand:+ start:7959 stop:9794 length:1836 start_codon:yes stop_codon:yes gene_type:complete